MTTAQALQSILGSLAVILALIVQTWLSKRFGEKKAAQITMKLDEVHDVVNGAAASTTARVEQLTAALTDSGTVVPSSPLQPPPPQPEGA